MQMSALIAKKARLLLARDRRIQSLDATCLRVAAVAVVVIFATHNASRIHLLLARRALLECQASPVRFLLFPFHFLRFSSRQRHANDVRLLCF